jgi:hypothetical protein
MTKRLKQLALAAAVPLLAAASAPTTIEGGDRWLIDECGLCSQFGPGPNGRHKFDDDTGDTRSCQSFPEEWTYCHPNEIEGGCFNQHYDCTAELPEPADLVLAARSAAAAAKLRDTYPANIRLNQERQALQLHDCRGQLIAHVTVSASISAALE